MYIIIRELGVLRCILYRTPPTACHQLDARRRVAGLLVYCYCMLYVGSALFCPRQQQTESSLAARCQCLSVS